MEHDSHIRIGAKRKALDALEAARRRAAGNGDEDRAKEAEIEAVVEVINELTSQSAVGSAETSRFYSYRSA